MWCGMCMYGQVVEHVVTVWGKHGLVLVISDKVMWWRGSHVIGKEAVKLLQSAGTNEIIGFLLCSATPSWVSSK